MQEIPDRFQDGDWARMPSAGRTGKPGGRLRGLSRTTLLELDQMGLIKVIAIRKPGAAKALRLVFLPSVDRYLYQLATEPIPEQSPTPGKEEAPTSTVKKPPIRRKFP
jgi:hypothetical protein